MASITNISNTNKNSTFSNPVLRKLAGRGINFKDSVISQSEAIGAIENKIGWQDNNNLLRYGQNNDLVDFYDFSYSDIYSKKNIPFFDQSYPSKISKIRKYALQDEIETILDTLSDEIVVFDTDNYFAKVKWEEDLTIKEQQVTIIRDTLNDNFKRIYNLFGFRNENTAWHYTKKFLVDGFLAFEIIWDISKTNIVGFKELDPVSLIPKIYSDGTRGWVQFPQDPVKKKELTDSQVIFISFSSINGESRVSYTERLIRSFNLLRIMEQSRIIWSVVNSSYKTQFTIPVGGKSKTIAKQTLSSIMRSYREQINFDTDSGELTINGSSMMPFNKEYWLPEGESGKPSIETIGNDGPDLSDMEPLNYFTDKLIRVSKIPKNRFSKDESPTWGNSADSYTREEIYFNRFLTRLRSKIQEILLKPVLLQTKRDIPELQGDYTFDSSVTLQWTKYDVFEELKEVELLEKRLDIIRTASESLMSTDAEGNEVKYFSDEFLVRKYSQFSEDDLKLNIKLKKQEIERRKKESEELKASQGEDDGLGF